MIKKQKYLFLGKKEQNLNFASQSSAKPMLLHTLNLKIGLFQSKNKKLSEMLEISKRFKLTCLLRLQTKANQSIFQIFLNLHSRRNQQFFFGASSI